MTSSLIDAQHLAILVSNAHYDRFGLSSFTYGNGLQQTLTHSARGWLYKGSGNNVFNYNMTLTGDGNIVHKDVGLNSATTNEHWDYSFDDFNRIAAANQPNAVL